MNTQSTRDPLRERAGYAHIAWVLLSGLLLSILVMVAGLIAEAVSGQPATTVLPLNQEPAHLVEGNPDAMLDLGILLLFATPIAGVVTAFVEFWAQRDRAFILVTGGLLVMFVIAFAIALH
jgi:uncharacterized membrane protein